MTVPIVMTVPIQHKAAATALSDAQSDLPEAPRLLYRTSGGLSLRVRAVWVAWLRPGCAADSRVAERCIISRCNFQSSFITYRTAPCCGVTTWLCAVFVMLR